MRAHLWGLSLLTACGVPGGASTIGQQSAALDVSSEVELSTGRPDGIVDSSLGTTERIALASDGSGLAAWEDIRSDTAYEESFTRFDAQGAPLDPDGVTVPGFRLRGASIASDGTDYLIYFASGGTLNLIRYSAQGTFLDATPQRIGSNGFAAHAAFSQGAYLLAWADCRGVPAAQCNATSLDAGIDVYAFRVTPAGVDEDDGGFLISNAARAQMPTSVAASPDGWLVAWNDQRAGDNDVYVARVVGNTVLDPTGIALASGAGDQHGATVAYEGSAWAAAYVDELIGGAVRTVLMPLDGGTWALNTVSPGGASSPSVACVPGTCLVSWTQGGALVGRRLSGAGLVLDAAPLPLVPQSASPFSAQLGATATQIVAVATTELEPLEVRLNVAPAWDAGTITLQRPTTFSWSPLVVATSSGWVTAWSEETHPTGGDVYAMRFDAYGQPIDAAPLAIAATVAWETDAVLCTDGTNALALWAAEQTPGMADYELEGVLVPPSGALGAHVHVAAATGVPQVAFNDGRYLVVFLDNAGSTLYGARIAADGTVLDPTGFALNGYTNVSFMRLVASGGGFLMLLGIGANGGTTNVDLHLVRLDLDGLVLDDRTFLTEPQVVSWDQASAGPLGPHAFAWRTARSGTVHNVAWLFDADGGEVATDVNLGNTALAAALAWDGDRFRAANSIPSPLNQVIALLDVFPDGGVTPQGVVPSTPTGDALYPKLAIGAPSVGMLVEQRWVKPRERSFARLIAFGDAGLPTPPVMDGGVTDGGAADAGLPDGGTLDRPLFLRAGCGCDASSFSALPALLLALRLRRLIRPRNG
jgi:hypothetical protein